MKTVTRIKLFLALLAAALTVSLALGLLTRPQATLALLEGLENRAVWFRFATYLTMAALLPWVPRFGPNLPGRERVVRQWASQRLPLLAWLTVFDATAHGWGAALLSLPWTGNPAVLTAAVKAASPLFLWPWAFQIYGRMMGTPPEVTERVCSLRWVAFAMAATFELLPFLSSAFH